MDIVKAREKVFALFPAAIVAGEAKMDPRNETLSCGATPLSRLSLDREKMSRPRQLGKIVSPSPSLFRLPPLGAEGIAGVSF